MWSDDVATWGNGTKPVAIEVAFHPIHEADVRVDMGHDLIRRVEIAADFQRAKIGNNCFVRRSRVCYLVQAVATRVQKGILFRSRIVFWAVAACSPTFLG